MKKQKPISETGSAHETIEAYRRRYQIDALRIPEEIIKEVGKDVLFIEGIYIYYGTDERVKEYKIIGGLLDQEIAKQQK